MMKHSWSRLAALTLVAGCWLIGFPAIAQPEIVEDEVFGEGYAFDRLLNLVDRKDNLPRLQQHPETGTHVYFEAEDFLNVNYLVDTEWTRHPAVWPLYHPAAICKAGPNTVCASTWTIQSPYPVTPKVAGPHRLWVRYVRWKQLPCLMLVRVRQAGKVVGEGILGVSEVADAWQAQVVWESMDATLDNSPLLVEIEKPKDEGLAGDRIVDCVYLTSNLDYVPVGRSQLPEIETLRERAARIGGGEPFVIWAADEPWDNFGIHDWPTGGELNSTVHLTACQNEKEPELVKITSMVEEPLMLNIEAGPLTGRDGNTYPSPQVRVAALLKTLRYDWAVLPLFRRSSVGLAPYHTAGLWITVDTHGMPLGQYRSTITLTGGGVQKEIEIVLTVHAVALERDPEFWTGCWGRPPLGPLPREELTSLWVRDLAEHGNNVFISEAPVEHFHLARQLGFVAVLDGDGAEESREALGLDREHFAVRFTDEPPINEHWRNVHQEFHRGHPDVMMWMNPTMLSADDVRFMRDLVDVWMPSEWNLVRNDTVQALYEWRSGAPWRKITFYNQFTSDATNPAKSWRWFRRMMWNSFAHDMDGCVFYSYSSYDGDPWNDGDGSAYGGGPGQFAVVYPGTAGPIPTPNWEAWSEGREDRDRLHLLSQAIAAAEKAGRHHAARQAQLIMDWAIQTALNAETAGDFRRANEAVVQAILMLEAKNAYILPDKQPLALKREGDYLELTLPRLEMHAMVAFE